ncbi:MAG: hypothetical protein ACK4GB_06905, partial [Tepidimonas sp.]
MTTNPLRRRWLRHGAAATLAACGGGAAGRMPRPSDRTQRIQPSSRGDFPNIPFADWTDEE